jgi:1,4-alpha-glucan branching enzyme
MPMMEAAKKIKATANDTENTAARDVELTFYSPQAKKVCIAGDFNNWNTKSMPLKRDRNGVWRIKLRLPRGRHEYKYFVDGEWDQNVPGGECVQNTFGTKNCVMNIQ